MAVEAPTLVLVGESNPYGADPRYALYDEPNHSAGGRLRRKILGIPRQDYFRHDRLNLMVGKWSAPRSREAVVEVRSLYRGRTLVLLGRKVATAFGHSKTEYYMVVHEACGTTLVLLPHPSGLNRMWSDPKAVERCRGSLRDAAPGIELGTL